MSIAPNVWALSNFFTEVLTKKSVQNIKGHLWDLTNKMDELGDRIRKIAWRLEEGVKAVVTPGMLFEALGFKYYGPINGHNTKELVEMLRRVQDTKGPILLHVSTQKGKGYAPAENDPKQNLHAVTPFDKITGAAVKKPTAGSTPPAYTKVFGNAMVEICKQNPKVLGITAAMPDGTGLDILQKEVPDKFFDVGIAEQHGVTFAAGLATQGFVPVAAIYSTFLQRAYDQIIHDVALQKLHVVFAMDRAGLVGADGPTHHGAFDLSYLRIIPGMVIMAPKDESELRDMLYTAVNYTGGPVALRYPRGNGVGVPLKQGFDALPIGKGEILRKGNDVAIIAIGLMVQHSLKAAELLAGEGIEAEVVNARFAKPLDTQLLDDICSRFVNVVTVEDNVCSGGFGSAVLEYIGQNHPHVRVHIHGIPDRFIEHGTPEQLYHDVGIDAPGIAEFVRKNCGIAARQSTQKQNIA
jgi:1-deoxy-D-xylulose-5-phosphate synthase